MEIEYILKLFNRTTMQKEWGEDSYIMFNIDGSGIICDGDDDRILEFDSPTELKYKLEEQ